MSMYSALVNSVTGSNDMKPAISEPEVLCSTELGISQALMQVQKINF